MSNLNSDYTFETFGVGQSNRDAYEAARSVVKSPGKIHNPLLIYGGNSVGKTHLLQAIAYEIQKKYQLRTLYLTCDEFKKHFHDTNVTIEKFFRKYFDAEVLLFDDLDDLFCDEEAEKVLFYILKILYASQKQIVVSVDNSLLTKETSHSRFYDYFEPGLSVYINPPDCDVRASMIRNATKSETWRINDEAIQYIASSISNPVSLKLNIMRLRLFCIMNHVWEISPELVKKALPNLCESEKTDAENPSALKSDNPSQTQKNIVKKETTDSNQNTESTLVSGREKIFSPKAFPLFSHLFLEAEKVYPVIVTSTMSSGKSTLINALAGMELLPSQNQACTSKAIAILDNDHMQQFGAHLIDQQGHYSFIPDLATDAVNDYNETDKFSEILLEGNIRGVFNTLKSILVIDTPGINNCMNSSHAVITKDIFKMISEGLILYVINTQQVGTDDDNNFLSFIAQKVKENPQLKILFIVNKVDLIDPEEENIERFMLSCKKYIESLGIKQPVIVPVSAYGALLFKKAINQLSLTRKEQIDFFMYADLFHQKEPPILDHFSNHILFNDPEFVSINGKEYKCSQLRAALQNTGLPLLEEMINKTMISALHFATPKVTYKE